MAKDLTSKQEAFCKEVVANGGDQSAAYRECYNASKMQDKTIWEKATVLMAEGKVSARVSELRKEVAQIAAKKFEITIEDVMALLKSYVYSDVTDFLSLDIKAVQALPIEIRRLVTEFKRKEKTTVTEKGLVTETTFELKFIDKQKALDMVNRHIGYYEKDNEQQATQLHIIKTVIGGKDS